MRFDRITPIELISEGKFTPVIYLSGFDAIRVRKMIFDDVSRKPVEIALSDPVYYERELNGVRRSQLRPFPPVFYNRIDLAVGDLVDVKQRYDYVTGVVRAVLRDGKSFTVETPDGVHEYSRRDIRGHVKYKHCKGDKLGGVWVVPTTNTGPQ